MKPRGYVLACTLVLCAANAAAQSSFQSSDLLKMRWVSSVKVSPDAARVTYTIENNDGAGRPYGQVWVMTLADGKTVRFGSDKESSGNPEWAPDGQPLAYRGRVGGKAGLVVAKPDGTGARFLVEMSGTNNPLPTTGKTLAWSPDGKRIAFVSSVPGPETADATGDPIVITRYLYKPDEIAFVSNREPNEDQFFNYDLFTQGNLMDTLLQRSAIRHVANAHTPTMLMHGENDNGVPIAEAEQFYIGLRDVGTEAIMVRYQRLAPGICRSRGWRRI